MDKKRYLCLQDIPLFIGLDKNTFSIICRAACRQIIRKGDFLFHQGDVADKIYIVKEGNIKLILTTENGDETILQIVTTGEILGDSALFRGTAFRPVTAIAMEGSKVCSIDRDTFEKIVKTEPDLAWQIIKNLSNRLYNTWEQLTESNTQDAHSKALNLLLRLAHEHGEPCAQGEYIKIPLTQQEIASLVGLSRVRVSQVINKLINEDYLAKDRMYYILKSRCF